MWLFTSSTGTFTFFPETPPRVSHYAWHPSPALPPCWIQAAKMSSLAAGEWDKELLEVKLRRKWHFIHPNQNFTGTVKTPGQVWQSSDGHERGHAQRLKMQVPGAPGSLRWETGGLGVCCWLWKVEVESLEVLECEGNGSNTPAPSTFFLSILC